MTSDRRTAKAVRPARNARVANDNACQDSVQDEAPPPSLSELIYLSRALSQPGGKLPLFDLDGQEVDHAVVRRCMERGWAEPWFNNPLKPDWLVCKLTPAGRVLVEGTA